MKGAIVKGKTSETQKNIKEERHLTWKSPLCKKLTYKTSILIFTIISAIISARCGETEIKELETIQLPPKIAISFEGEPKAVLIKTDGKNVAQIIDWMAEQGAFHQIIFSYDGKLVFIANSTENMIHVLDGETFTLIKNIKVGSHPTHMSLSEDGKILAVVSEGSGETHFISIDKLETVGVISGLHTPHFPRYSEGKWFIANASANVITVVDAQNYKVINELSVDGEPKICPQEQECGFFDVGVKSIAKLGAGVHSSTGKFILFNTENLNILKKDMIQLNLNPPLNPMHHHDSNEEQTNHIADQIMAKVPVLSQYDQMLYIPFVKGVYIYNTISALQEHLVMFSETYIPDTATEIPSGVLIPMFDRNKVAIVSRRGEIKKVIDVGGNPSMVSLWNDTAFLVVLTEDAKKANVISINQEGDMHLIAELEGKSAHGIHIPGVYARCH